MSLDKPIEVNPEQDLEDQPFSLSGVYKAPVLEAFNPHLFFDDQDVHVASAAKQVPTGKVRYRSDSTLRDLQEEKAQLNGEP